MTMAETKTLTLRVIGDQTMHCSGCERTVQFTLSRLPGVQRVKADHKTQRIELQVGSEAADLEKLKAELDWIGYQVEVI